MSSIPVSRNRRQNYFSGIDDAIVLDVENGSPENIRRAVSLLRKPENEYKENEKVLIYIASSIMQLVWTYEDVNWEIPSVGVETPYAGAISSVKYGLYDTSTGKVDYLATLLPSLIIARTNDVSSFYSEAEADLKTCYETHKDSVLLNYLLGLLYKKNKEYEKANTFLSKAYNDAKNCYQCAYDYSENLNLLGKASESFEISHVLVEKYPRDINALDLNAKNAFSLKDYATAEECIAKILQQNPNNLSALLFRIAILVEKKDYIHAAALLDVYSREDNKSRNYLLLRAKVQYDWSKNTNAAVSTIENALSLYPDDEELLLFAARIASSSNMKIAGKSSEDIASEILEKDSSNYNALRYSVEGLVQKKEWNKAYQQSSILMKNPDLDEESIFLHIQICLAIGRNDEAWNLISPIYKENSTDENVVQSYIMVLQATKRNNQALNLINELLPNASARMKSFLYYRRSFLKTREEEILSDLRSSLIANPRNSDALFRLYEIYYNKNDYRKAQYYLKQVVALNPTNTEYRALNDSLTLKISNSN